MGCEERQRDQEAEISLDCREYRFDTVVTLPGIGVSCTPLIQSFVRKNFLALISKCSIASYS